jgi:hypothetical protein
MALATGPNRIGCTYVAGQASFGSVPKGFAQGTRVLTSRHDGQPVCATACRRWGPG